MTESASTPKGVLPRLRSVVLMSKIDKESVYEDYFSLMEKA